MKKNKILEINKKLAQEFGSTFCFEKYYNTTIHLHTGETHSCHHPETHKIPLKELENNPSALHNTKEKKKERKEMAE